MEEIDIFNGINRYVILFMHVIIFMSKYLAVLFRRLTNRTSCLE